MPVQMDEQHRQLESELESVSQDNELCLLADEAASLYVDDVTIAALANGCCFSFLLLEISSSVFRWNHSSASASAYSDTFLHRVVCLSVICRIRAPCIYRSTDLDAIWQVHSWGPMTHCVRCSIVVVGSLMIVSPEIFQ